MNTKTPPLYIALVTSVLCPNLAASSTVTQEWEYLQAYFASCLPRLSDIYDYPKELQEKQVQSLINRKKELPNLHLSEELTSYPQVKNQLSQSLQEETNVLAKYTAHITHVYAKEQGQYPNDSPASISTQDSSLPETLEALAHTIKHYSGILKTDTDSV